MLSIEPSDMKHALEATQKEIHTLKDRLQTAQDELRQAEANVSQLKRKYGTHKHQGVFTCVYVRGQICCMHGAPHQPEAPQH